MVIPSDVSVSDDVNKSVEAVTDTFGPVDILVNDAGIAEGKPFLQISDEDWHRVMGINLDGPFISAGRWTGRCLKGKAGRSSTSDLSLGRWAIRTSRVIPRAKGRCFSSHGRWPSNGPNMEST